MNVYWTEQAQQDRLDIFTYIAEDNPRAAISVDELFSDAADRLAAFPKMGTPGEVPGTRELFPHRSYRVVYEIIDDQAWILTVVHTARRWPPDAT